MRLADRIFIPLFLFFFPFCVYFFTLCPSVYSGDSGELITAAYFLGVPHPPGYPLYTLLGNLFTKIPFSSSVAWKINLMSAFFQAATLPFLYLILLKLTKRILPSLLACLIFAFSYLFWRYATVAEVFALNNFLATLLILTALNSSLYLFAFIFGLSLSHHHTIVLLIPGFLYLFLTADKTPALKAGLPQRGSIFRNWRLLGNLAFLVFLGLLFYLYLPWAALRSPPINWDNPTNLERFIHLVTRRDYGTFQASQAAQEAFFSRVAQLKLYPKIFLADFTLVGFVLTFLGAIWFFFNNRKIFYFLFINFLVSGPLFLFYASWPLGGSFSFGIIERFYFFSYFMIVVWLGGGIFLIGKAFERIYFRLFGSYEKVKLIRLAVEGVFALVVFSLLASNWQRVSLRGNFLGRDLADNILSTPEKGAILFALDDTVTFNAMYLHLVEEKRPDLKFVALGVLRTDWYPQELKRRYPELNLENLDDEEKPRVLRFIENNYEKFPIYAYRLEGKARGWEWAPVGLLSRIYREEEKPFLPEIIENNQRTWRSYKLPSERFLKGYKDLFLEHVFVIYSEALHRAGKFFFLYNSYLEAEESFKQALYYQPDWILALESLGDIYLAQGECGNSLDIYFQLVEVNPNFYKAYQKIAGLYRDCLKDPVKAAEYEEIYREKIRLSEESVEKL